MQFCCVCVVFAGTLHDAVHRLPRSHLLVVSYVSRRKGAKFTEVWHLRRRAMVGRGMQLHSIPLKTVIKVKLKK